jgi:TonB family protein
MTESACGRDSVLKFAAIALILIPSVALADGQSPTSRPVPLERGCGIDFGPALKLHFKKVDIAKPTIVHFVITTYGTVRNTSIKQSSGVADFDSLAVFCAQNRRYEPATENGVAIEVPWDAEFDWRGFRHGLPPH